MNLQEAIARAENGDIDAMVDVAEYIVWEENVKSDIDPELGRKVLEYLGKAIEAGNDQAMNLLGTMYSPAEWWKKTSQKPWSGIKRQRKREMPCQCLTKDMGTIMGTG